MYTKLILFFFILLECVSSTFFIFFILNQVSNTNATCRVCLTCRSGYSLGKDGVTCGLCPNRDNLGKGAAAAVVLTLLVLLMFVLLIYLKIKAATSGAKGSKGKYSKRRERASRIWKHCS